MEKKKKNATFDKKTDEAIKFLESHLVTPKENQNYRKTVFQTNRENAARRRKTIKTLFYTFITTLALLKAVDVVSPNFMKQISLMENNMIRHSLAVDVQSTQKATTEQQYNAVSENARNAIYKATFNENQNVSAGTVTFTDLIEDLSTNSTYIVALTANHIKDSAENATLHNQNNPRDYSATVTDWMRYGESDLALVAFRVDGLVYPYDPIQTIDYKNIINLSSTSLANCNGVTLGYASQPGVTNYSLLPSQNYSLTTMTDMKYQDNGKIKAKGQSGPSMSGGPLICNNNIIGVVSTFDSELTMSDLINPNIENTIIQPIPSDFAIFYDNFVSKLITNIQVSHNDPLHAPIP